MFFNYTFKFVTFNTRVNIRKKSPNCANFKLHCFK